MSRIRAAAPARLAVVEEVGDVRRANLTTARDYEATLGIPLPIALVGECVCLGASRRYA